MKRILLICFVVSAIDLLERMLELDAEKRITAEQALAHPYLAQYADPSDEPTSLPYDQTFEDFDLPVEQWKGNFATCLAPPSKLFFGRSVTFDIWVSEM